MTLVIKYLMTQKDREYHKDQTQKYRALREKLINETNRRKRMFYSNTHSLTPNKQWSKINQVIKPKISNKLDSLNELNQINQIFSDVFETEDKTKAVFFKESFDSDRNIGVDELTVFNTIRNIKS